MKLSSRSAALTYVREQTLSKEKLFYIGHSMGTLMFWIAMNEHQVNIMKSMQ
jgi:hypothetical protein